MTAYSGFKIVELFHPTAMVTDLWAANEFYRRVFGAAGMAPLPVLV